MAERSGESTHCSDHIMEEAAVTLLNSDESYLLECVWTHLTGASALVFVVPTYWVVQTLDCGVIETSDSSPGSDMLLPASERMRFCIDG